MHFLFIGEDTAGKDKKIGEIKHKIFPDANALSFDFEVLHAVKLDPDALKKSLINLPAVSAQRLILIRQANKLSARHKEILLEQIKSDAKHFVLILDYDAGELKDGFIDKIRKNFQIVEFRREISKNAFDMTRAISQRKPSEALSILFGLLTDGEQPVMIMGALVWFWGKMKERLPQKKFYEGLQALKEADLNIKRSRVKPDQALEIAVVKLSSLLAY